MLEDQITGENMDRITRSYLNDFTKSYGFDSEEKESIKFEHFVNFTLIENKTEDRYDIEELNIGEDGTLGIDGFALILNKQIIDNEDTLNDFLSSHREIYAEIVFIQSKTSRNFDVKEIGNFGWAVTDFISEKPKIKWTKTALEKIDIFNKLFEGISALKDKPVCQLYYVTLGINENDQNVVAKIDEIKRNIENENLFSQVKVDLVDASSLQGYYKKIGQAVTKSFEFTSKITLPEINEVKEAYLGVIDAPTIIDLMTTDEGDLLSNVFYDNVRDFQGPNKVNAEIKKTLESKEKNSFVILNNGLTIVTENLKTRRNTFTISNYQIINGCQTSHVLFQSKDLIDTKVQLPIKLIFTKDRDLTAKVIRSTNRQTEVSEQDLLAFSDFQKRLEDYYGTYSDPQKLYYERRSKQYNTKNIEKKKIIDKTTQIKTVASFFFDKPDMATRYFGTLFNEFGDKLFKDNHSMIPYYTASFSLYHIDELFRRKIIDKKYKKIRYFILMMLRREITSDSPPPFESNKIDKYCDTCLNTLSSQAKLIKLITSITKRIDSLKLDLSDNELSKSRSLVAQCINQYIIKRK
jgi:hypothetical protein